MPCGFGTGVTGMVALCNDVDRECLGDVTTARKMDSLLPAQSLETWMCALNMVGQTALAISEKCAALQCVFGTFERATWGSNLLRVTGINAGIPSSSLYAR